MVQILLVGIGAGLAAALLFISPIGGTGLAFPLFALSGLPIAIAGLGWTPLAGALAAAAGGAAIALFLSPVAAAIFLLFYGVPLFWAARMATLSRPLDEAEPAGPREWYPYGRVLLHIAVAVSVGLILIGVIIGFDPERLVARMSVALVDFLNATPELGPAPDVTELEPFVRFNLAVMPFTMAALGVVIAVFSLWLAAIVTRASGRLERPREPLWTAALPREAVIACLVAVIGAIFLSGPLGQAAGVVAGAFASAAALVGLAVVHALTRGTGARAVILVVVYALILFMGVPLLLLAILGLAENRLQLRARKIAGAPPSQSNPS